MEFKKIDTEYFKWFTNRKCEYFPCHRTPETEFFNCLFCYCPLYTLGDRCGGNFTYEEDIKDCSNCLIPHTKGGYQFIMKKYYEVKELASKNRTQVSGAQMPAGWSIRLL